MRIGKLISYAVVCLTLPLAACGFKPMYASDDEGAVGGATSAVRTSLAAVTIHPIADRDGVKLRQILRERMQPRGPAERPQFDLDVQIRTATQAVDILKNATSTRANLIYTANFFLLENGNRVYAAQSQSVVSYDILNDQYATVASIGDAGDRALRQIGDDIVARLSVFFEQRRQAAASH